MGRNLRQRRLDEGEANGIAAAWLVVVLGLLVGTPWLWWHGGVSERVVEPRRIEASLDDTMYHFSAFAVSRAPMRSALEVDSEGKLQGFFFATTGEGRDGGPHLLLFEDGEPLGPAVESRRALRDGERPAYYAFDRTVYFTTEDGSDPRRNGRTYSFKGYVRPRTSPLRVTALAGIWGVLAIMAVWSLRRRSEFLEPRRLRDAAPVLLLVATFSAYAFFLSRLNERVSVAFALLMAGIAFLTLLNTGRRFVFRPWMAWLLAFLLWSSVRLALDPHLTGSWHTVGLLWLTASLGMVVWTALVVTPRIGVGSWHLPIVAFFVVFAAFVTLQNLGFDWKGEILAWTEFETLARFSTLWNQKFTETWMLLFAWALVARAGIRRRGELLLILFASAAVILTGYSQTVKAALVVSLVVFLVARWRPRGALLPVACAAFGLLFTAPFLGRVGWEIYSHQPQVVHNHQELSQHLAPRLLSWGYASDVVSQRPVAGWGPGSAARSPASRDSAVDVWPRIGEPGASRIPDDMKIRRPLPGGHPHNLPLLVWIDTGALGVLCVAGLLFTIFRGIHRVAQVARLAPSLALFVAVWIVYFFNYPAFDPAPSFLLFVVAGVASE